MAIVFNTSNSGLWYRIGRLAGTAADIVALRGGAATDNVLAAASITTRGNTVDTMLAASPNLSPYADGHWSQVEAFRSSGTAFLQYLANLAQTILIRQVDSDVSLPALDVASAIAEVKRQMVANSYSIQSSTVSLGSQTAQGTPTGNPVLVGTLLNTLGETVQTPFAETLRLTCDLDVARGATARQERFSLRGAAVAPNVFSHLYPGGSGVTTALRSCDAQLNNSGGNVLVNGAFETFTTSNYPDNWVIATGDAGTTIFSNGSGYTLTNALKFTGDVGGTLMTLRQSFKTSTSTSAGAGGSPASLLPNTLYAVNGFVKVSAAPSAGVLRLRLVDGSNAVINNDAGNACSFTVDLTTRTTSYTAFNGTFVTPRVLPSAYKLEVGLSTAIDSAKSVIIDDLAMTTMTTLYQGGPSLAVFSGSTSPVVNDLWTMAVSCTRGVLADWLERFLSLRSLGVVLPHSGSPTSADSLVV